MQSPKPFLAKFWPVNAVMILLLVPFVVMLAAQSDWWHLAMCTGSLALNCLCVVWGVSLLRRWRRGQL